MNDKNVEKVAKLAHNIWSEWMEYMFSKCSMTENGEYVIPVELVERWQRQIDTDYNDLSVQEQQSDIEIAKLYITLIEGINTNG